MKTGNKVKDFKNKKIFNYNDKDLDYGEIYQLIKDLDYKTSDDCNWIVLKGKDCESGKSCIIIAFQESDSRSDWKDNFTFFPHPTKAYKGWFNRLWFHDGFFKQYQSARDEIKSDVSSLIMEVVNENNCHVNEVKIFVIGWSLGASITPICCEDIYFTYCVKPTMIGYEGANPCWGSHTKKVISECLSDDSISFVYANDIVPRLPPFIFGFKSLKDIIYYFPKKILWIPIYHLIAVIVDTIKNTPYYHCHVDEPIKNITI